MRGGDAKPIKGLGSSLWEIALRYQTNAYRTVYAVELDDAIWIVHAFQNKSPKRIKTAKQDVDLIQRADFSRIRKADLSRFTLDKLVKMVGALD